MAINDMQAANAAVLASGEAFADLNKQLVELTAYQDSVNTTINIPTMVAGQDTGIYYLYSQNGVVNVAAANGGIIFPTGTTAQRPSEAVSGTVRYNSNTQSLEIYTTDWQAVGTGVGGSSGGIGDTGGAVQGIFYENSAEITANYSSPFGKNIHSSGPLNLTRNNVFVTIANSSVWTIT